ncbi:MAG TPA: glycosyltransferase, partial [Candidatus Hydrogenedentes bacterium]|nr:glycosyltransferase [Candidatus Hydrogenedentota bacterium]
MKIVVAGGGTGGHTSPAVAVIEELRRRDPQLLLQWIGKKNSMEEKVAGQRHVPFRKIPVEGWTRKKSPRILITGIKLAWSLMRSWFYLRVFRPQVVFGVGGYVSLPAIWMAQRMGIHTVLHEQNKRLGLANRLCAARAS